METKNKVIIGVAILAIFAILVFTGTIGTTGNALIKQCSDTDGGSIYIKGSVSGFEADNNKVKYEKTDYCSAGNSDILKEYECDITSESGWRADTISCNHGCSNGACIKGSGSDTNEGQIF